MCRVINLTGPFLILVLTILVPVSQCANILFFIGFGGKSHKIAMEPLAFGLADKGHNVTFLYHEDDKDHPKVHYYRPEKLLAYFTESMTDHPAFDFYGMRKEGKLALANLFLPGFGMDVCKHLYLDEKYLEWLHSNKFDIVVVDFLFNECGYGIAHLHGAKLVIFSVSTIPAWLSESIGIPDETSSVPDMMFHPPKEMTFLQRILNVVQPILWRFYREWYYLPKLHDFTQKGLGLTNFPSFSEIEKNVSLVFVNTHPSIEYPRSLPPNVIPVLGFAQNHTRKPLPKPMQDFVDQGKDGFVYISFGSFIDFSSFPDEVKENFISALGKFKNLRFIWKLEETPKNLPANFYVDKWMPQKDILSHPKIKAFITHSGLGGVNEAVTNRVPMICFPVFAEQDYNAELVKSKGFGIRLEITEFTEEDLVNALNEILRNDKYREKVKLVHKQFMDRPAKALDTALWWMEFLLRHENTDFLRSDSVKISWWKKRQLDVWMFLLGLTFSSVFLTFYLIKKICKRLLCKRSTETLKEKTQ